MSDSASLSSAIPGGAKGKEVELMYQISKILGTGLDRQALAIVKELIEVGVHPESIADGKSL